ncbi:hypothetical protein D3C78_1009160 [compost metagenome]
MAVELVLDVAVAAGPVGRNAPGQGLAQGPGQGALGLEVAILAHRSLDAALGGKARRPGADVDHPGGGVLTEQGALRTAQHFQLLDVHQVEHRHARTAEVDVVQVQANAAFQAITGRVVAQTANRHAGLARMHVGDVDARHQLLQVLYAVHALGFQRLAIDHTHRCRHVLGTLLATPGGHGDSLELAVAGFHRSLLRFGGLGWQPVRTAGQQQGQGQALEPP